MPADPTMRDRAGLTADQALRRLVGIRLGQFTASWLAMMLTWVAVLSLASTSALVPAVLTTIVHVAMLAALWRASLARPEPWYPQETAFATCIVIGVSSIGLFAWVDAPGELLSFALFTLCLVAGLVFAWGWRFELAMFGVMLVPFVLARPWLEFSVSAAGLNAAIVIGTAVAVAIAEGSARGFRVAFERRQRERAALRALAASRNAYRDLTEGVRDAIWEVDRAGRFTYLNAAGAEMLGRTPNELVGQNIDALISDDPRNPDVAANREALAAGRLLGAQHFQTRTPHGTRWFENVSSPVHGPEGDVVGFRGITRDVTDRFETDERLRASEERYRGVIDSQTSLIFRSGLDGTLRFLNDACRRQYGVEDTRPEDLNYLSFVHPDDAVHARAAIQALQPGQRFHRQSRGRTPAGWRWIEWEVSAIVDEHGKVSEIQGVGRDVTEQRAADDALQQTLADLRRREEQLRLMALRQVAIREEERKRLGLDLHDGVCQELVGINILIESAREQMLGGPARSGLARAQEYITQVGEHLRRLARNLRPLQLADLGLAESLRTLADGMSDVSTTVTAHFPNDVPRLGEDTEVAVYRVAQEALTNAVRHAGAHTITLSVTVQDGTLALEVRDDGCGFDYDALRPKALGLVAMEERAAALDGTLRTTTAPGAGTTVRLECPVTIASPQSAA